MADAYRETVETLERDGRPGTIHVELEVGEYVDVWGLCKPFPRSEGEPLLPTQYREDVLLPPQIASDLDQGLRSRAKERKVRRNAALVVSDGKTWSVAEAGRVVGTLGDKPFRRLHEVMDAGLPLDVVMTIHRRPERPLSVHVSIPPDA